MRTRIDIIETGFAPTKAAAYTAGVNKLNQLKSTPSNVLEYQVEAPLGMVESGILRVNDDSFVTAQERVATNGQKGYVGVVKVGLSYEEQTMATHSGNKSRSECPEVILGNTLCQT